MARERYQSKLFDILPEVTRLPHCPGGIRGRPMFHCFSAPSSGEKELFLRALESVDREKQAAFLAQECGLHDSRRQDSVENGPNGPAPEQVAATNVKTF